MLLSWNMQFLKLCDFFFFFPLFFFSFWNCRKPGLFDSKHTVNIFWVLKCAFLSLCLIRISTFASLANYYLLFASTKSIYVTVLYIIFKKKKKIICILPIFSHLFCGPLFFVHLTDTYFSVFWLECWAVTFLNSTPWLCIRHAKGIG